MKVQLLTKKVHYCTYSPSNACINKYFLIYKNKQSNTPATRDHYLEKRIMQKRLTEDNSCLQKEWHILIALPEKHRKQDLTYWWGLATVTQGEWDALGDLRGYTKNDAELSSYQQLKKCPPPVQLRLLY